MFMYVRVYVFYEWVQRKQQSGRRRRRGRSS